MLIQKSPDIKSSEITSEKDYINRRKFIKFSALTTGSLVLKNTPLWASTDQEKYPELSKITKSSLSTDEKKNSWDDITTYNNFYEFGTSKDDPSENAGTLKPRPWKVEIGGLCKKPASYDVDDLIKISQLEERE